MGDSPFSHLEYFPSSFWRQSGFHTRMAHSRYTFREFRDIPILGLFPIMFKIDRHADDAPRIMIHVPLVPTWLSPGTCTHLRTQVSEPRQPTGQRFCWSKFPMGLKRTVDSPLDVAEVTAESPLPPWEDCTNPRGTTLRFKVTFGWYRVNINSPSWYNLNTLWDFRTRFVVGDSRCRSWYQ